MSSHPKFTVTSHSEPVRSGNLYRLAIVGAGSLKGKEVAEVLNDRNFPSIDIKLLDDDESLGQLEAVRDEVTFIQSVRSEQFENIDFTFFASDSESTIRNWKTARKAGSAIVDLSYALEDESDAVVRSPRIDRLLGRVPMPELQPGPSVIAHPSAVVLATLLLRAQKAGAVKQAVATVFEPASEHGQKGMDELHEQTVNLLSFQPLPKNVFDTQIAFNLLTRYGDRSVPALAVVERRIVKHYRQIAGENAVVPSLLLVQAPVFHGYAFAVHLEMTQPTELARVTQALTGEHVIISRAAEDAPSNVNAAGQADILVSVVPDSNSPNAYWLWAATDNLRIAASTAVECAESMAASRPRGKIQ
jgi:aspartate-semialdehyde dehydrogenase